MISQGYRLYTVVPRLLQLIDNLTNWYIRFNRKRLKGAAGLEIDDTQQALNTLCHVLFTLVRALAPFTPFITEHIYGLLKPYLSQLLSNFQDTRSVHFLPYPVVQDSLFDEAIERKVEAMQKVIQLGRTARERAGVPLKTPLLCLVAIADQEHLSDVDSLQSYIKDELNVRDLVLSSDEARYNIQLQARVDWPTLGKKLKKNVQVVRRALPALSQEQLRRFQRDRKMTIEGIELEGADLSIVRVLGDDTPKASSSSPPSFAPIGEVLGAPIYEAAFSDDLVILLDTTPRPELLDEGLARDIVNRVQRMRKKAGLDPADDILVQYGILSNPDGVDVDQVIETRQVFFEGALRGRMIPFGDDGPLAILEEDHAIGGLVVRLKLARA